MDVVRSILFYIFIGRRIFRFSFFFFRKFPAISTTERIDTPRATNGAANRLMPRFPFAGVHFSRRANGMEGGKGKREISLYERSEFKLLFHPSPLFLPFLFLSPLLSLRQGFVPSYKSQYPLVSAARRKERRKVAVAEWNMKIFASAKYRLLFTRPTSLCLYAPPRAKLCSFLYFLVGFHENIQRSMIVSTSPPERGAGDGSREVCSKR